MLDFDAAEKKRTRRIIFTIVCSLIVLLGSGIIAGVAWKQVSTPTTSTTVKAISVPALVGRDVTKARKLTESLGLKLKIESWIVNKVYPVNSIVTQKPLPGKLMLPGGTLTVRISSGVLDDAETDRKKPAINMDNPKPLPSPALQTRPFEGMTIAIDAGHQQVANNDKEPVGPGSKTVKPKTASGTRGAVTKVLESEVTLELANKLEENLNAHGIKTLMVRTEQAADISNIERTEMANNANATLFVRIHCDGSTDHDKSGISVLYPNRNQWTESIYEPSLRAATLIHDHVISTTSAHDGGIVGRSDLTGFNWSKVPVVLVETGFLTNPQEEASLTSDTYQELLIKGLSEGIVQYLKQGTP